MIQELKVTVSFMLKFFTDFTVHQKSDSGGNIPVVYPDIKLGYIPAINPK